MPGIADFFRGWDAYPVPITMRYNRKGAFATVPGGISSMISDLMITYWIVTTILETYVSGYDSVTKIVIDPKMGGGTTRKTDMLRSQFNFMVKISSTNETLNMNSEKYIVPTVINKIWDPKKEEFRLENYQMYPCSNFMNMSMIKVVDELSSAHDMEFLCIRDEDHWKLELDHVRSRIFVVLDTCATITKKHDFMAYKGQCASDDELEDNLRKFEVKVVFKN
jgi:hypothetical protein